MITKPKTETCIAINIHSIVSFFLAWFHGLIFYIFLFFIFIFFLFFLFIFSLLSLWEKGERARKNGRQNVTGLYTTSRIQVTLAWLFSSCRKLWQSLVS